MITSQIQIFWARSILFWFVVSKLILLFTARGLSAQSSLKNLISFQCGKLHLSKVIDVMAAADADGDGDGDVNTFQMVSWLAVVFYFCFRSWLSLPALVATSPRTPSSRRRPPTGICHSSGNAIFFGSTNNFATLLGDVWRTWVRIPAKGVFPGVRSSHLLRLRDWTLLVVLQQNL